MGDERETFVVTRHRGQHTVLSRLQGLFPHFQQNPIHIAHSGGVAESENAFPQQSSRETTSVEPKLLKVRILTWNMHDSLPKGELDELLGTIPTYNNLKAKSEYFPNLSNDANHPYHLVVIAGQECPTPSGIPKGLGASFKLLDKERDKSKDSDERSNTRPIKDKDQHIEVHKPEEHVSFETLPLGWTSIVEDWLCHGGITVSRMKTPSTPSIGLFQPIRRIHVKEPRKGPYQLLIKERLMGIYMAIYIHRDLKSSVQGMSKSAVAAGLIGGRVGNKGGVGISLKLAGTTFLFLNAHLAAHEGKMNHRVANLSKIKTELDVDTFLPSDDPRMMAEDLTDKFDFTFLCGDLNFRLDVSRLHADWLISRRDYAQALEFDQLRALMKEETVLNGFKEGLINFPPTFKYDVLRTSKRSKRQTFNRLDPAGSRPAGFTEPEERDIEETEEEDVECASLVSSVMTSLNSRPTTEPGMQEDNSFHTFKLPVTPPRVISSKKPSTVLSVANRAKAKWLALLPPSSPTLPGKPPKQREDEFWPQIPPPTPPSPRVFHSSLSSSVPNFHLIPNENLRRRFLRPSPLNLINPPDLGYTSQEDPEREGKGVYDSSRKRRVPSWCDRVLWKTTVISEPVPKNNVIQDSATRTRPQPRVSQLLAHAFWLSPSRTLSDSSTPKHLTSSDVVSANDEDPCLYQSNSISSPPTAPLPLLPRSTTSDSSFPRDRPHSASTSKWRFLPAFLSPTSPQSNTVLEDAGTPVPSKGDIVCLSYNTLDDRGMRRLEGRSDHRPVIAMQGFNKYYPPDYDPSQGSLNTVRGKHALGDRARKLDQGILITRFELPFNIWCGTCNNHIGMGVRYNAEKKKIGAYFSTPIFSFRCKCHLCDGWFEIQTDPKNTRYIVTSGARQKDEDWDPEANGGFAIHDSEKVSNDHDPLADLEKTTNAKRHMDDVQIPRIESLQNVSEHYNSDPYSLSSKARRKFREEKKIELKKRQSDDILKGRYGLPASLSLMEDDLVAVQEAKAEWEKGKQELQLRESKRRKTVTQTSLIPSSARIKNHSLGPLNSLRTQLLQNTAKRAGTTKPKQSTI